MIRLLFVSALLLFFQEGKSQEWFKSAGGLYQEEAFDVETDINGNIYSTGYITSTSEFGATTITSAGNTDIYVSKSDVNGNFIWAKAFGGGQADLGHDLAVDTLGNIYVTGYFTGTATFGAFTLTATGTFKAAFTMKLDPSGTVLWANADGSTLGANGYGIAVDHLGNVLVTGQFKGQAQIGGISYTSGIDPLTSASTLDAFIVKYSASGAALWSHQGMTVKNDVGLTVHCDGTNNVYVAGHFSDTLSIAGTVQNNAIQAAGFIIKFDPAGTLLWFQRLAAIQTHINDIETDGTKVWVTGNFLGQMLYTDIAGNHLLNNPYLYHVFVMNITSDGNLVWWDAVGSDSEVHSYALTIDANHDIYIAGIFKCSFNEYKDSLNATGLFDAVGFNDIFISKYGANGQALWEKHYGGPRTDFLGGIAINQIDKPIVAGSYDEYFSFPHDGSGGFTFDTNQGMSVTGSCVAIPGYIRSYTHGKKDVFIGQPVSIAIQNYYYYLTPSCTDTLAALLNFPDSVEACFNYTISANTGTWGGAEPSPTAALHLYNNIGPFYTFDWSDGDTTQVNTFTQTGTYSVELERLDGCASATDSFHVTIHDVSIRFNDDLGFNSNALAPYQQIHACVGDTVGLWLSDADTTTNYGLSMPDGTVHNDTLVHYFIVPAPGTFTGQTFVIDSFGCTRDGIYEIIAPNLFIDTIVPYLMLFDDVDFNDSISICEGDQILVSLYDSITNPTGDIYAPFVSHIYTTNWNNAGDIIQNTITGVHNGLTPSATGWYTFTLDVVLGYSTNCGTDTMRYQVNDTFYVELFPRPQLTYNVYGDFLMCSGDTIPIWTDTLATGFTWSGPSIVGYSPNQDTIYVNGPGQYTLSGVLVDSINGCSQNLSRDHTLGIKPSPIISSNIPDNIICPGDSLLLTCQINALSYEWTGPSGLLPGTGASIWVHDIGYYQCLVMDVDSCWLTSNLLELFNYNTPYLITTPDTELCVSGSADIDVIHSGLPSFNWINPPGVTASSITVTQPGTYICEISQCGVVVRDSVVITLTTLNPIITAFPDTLFCPGDSITLSTQGGMDFYNWSIPNNYTSSITVFTPGSYAVSVMDGNGCSATSDTIVLQFHPGSAAPTVSDVTVCAGDSVTLLNTTGQNTTWYAQSGDTIPIGTDSVFYLSNVLSDTVVFVQTSGNLCTSDYYPVQITVSSASQPYQILGDSVYCSNDTLVLSTNLNGSATYQWSGPNGFSSALPTVVITPTDTGNTGIYTLSVSDNLCVGDTNNISVIVHPQEQILLNYLDSVFACPMDTVALVQLSGLNGIWQPTNTSGDTLWTNIPGTYYVIGNDQNGCAANSDTIVLVSYLVAAPLATDTSVCLGDSTLLHSSGQLVSWYDENLNLITTSTTLNTGPLQNDTSFFITHLDGNGCTSDFHPVTVTVIPVNGSVNIYGDTVLCEGETLFLWTDVIAGVSYTWTGTSTPPGAGTDYTVNNMTTASSGIITLQGTGNSCISASQNVQIVVHALPVSPVITGDSVVCQNDSIQLFGNSTTIVWADDQLNILDTGMTLTIYPIPPLLMGVYASTFDPVSGCISLPTYFPIQVNPNPYSQVLITNETLCFDMEAMLTITAPAGTSVVWQLPNDSIFVGDTLHIDTATLADQGMYFVQQTNAYGCTHLDSFEVDFDSIPTVDLGPDFLLCIDSTETLFLPNNSNIAYLWQNGSTDHFYEIDMAGVYHVTATSPNGCTGADTLLVRLTDCSMSIPNIFTPNGDGVNDFFEIAHLEYPNYLIIYNRWGDIVYETANYDNKWIGENLSEGVYYYLLYIGPSPAEANFRTKGYFHLYRD